MQPYFLPYIGYFQLIGAADRFVLYDNIKYTKKGWINRNRFLRHGSDAVFSLPLKHDSDTLDVRDRRISQDFDRLRFLNQFKEAYKQAPYFSDAFSLLEAVVMNEESNLFRFLHRSIIEVCSHLGIHSEIVISSDISIDHSLRGQDRVIAICRHLGADTYINPIGGQALYAHDIFQANGVDLRFLRPMPFEYAHPGGVFVPWLSIIDVLMFNPRGAVSDLVARKYQLI